MVFHYLVAARGFAWVNITVRKESFSVTFTSDRNFNLKQQIKIIGKLAHIAKNPGLYWLQKKKGWEGNHVTIS